MIPLQLMPAQAREVRAGSDEIHLTEQQSRTVRAILNASERKIHSGGAKPTCTCGTCKRCKKREAIRRYRAKMKA